MKKANLSKEIKLLEGKTIILQNAQCIDIDRAECAFLKDAKEAQGRITELLTQIELLKNPDAENLQKQQDDLKVQMDGLNYKANHTFYSSHLYGWLWL